ncbi:MAG: type II toxin-antitoxin system VapC family toxin [Planctomycetaceae bacterium]|nr:type II toxin-antitoxin system VapC family toxin [Planctomycetaceae bacterium]
MRYLVDSNILSEATRPRPNDRVIEWLRGNEAELAISPVVLGEIEYGILILPPGHRRDRLLLWLMDRVKTLRFVVFDAETASEWAQMMAVLKAKGLSMSVKDSLIAATARTHRLTVVTRNTADFRHAGVPLLNPFEEPTAE